MIQSSTVTVIWTTGILLSTRLPRFDLRYGNFIPVYHLVIPGPYVSWLVFLTISFSAQQRFLAEGPHSLLVVVVPSLLQGYLYTLDLGPEDQHPRAKHHISLGVALLEEDERSQLLWEISCTALIIYISSCMY